MPRIFTFWEPQSSLPGYLHLCMQTWRKFLPDHEIVVLNYANLDHWLGRDGYDSRLYENFSLPKQADAVRCAVLRRWGGVWFDADTIVTSGKVRDLLHQKAEFTTLDKHIGFISARRNAKILRLWETGLRVHIALYACCQGQGRLAGTMKRLLSDYLERWDFLGNLPLKIPLKIAEYISDTAFKSIDKAAVNAFPELSIAEGTVAEKYINYYFSDNSIENALNNGGLICLHNSWTPDTYKGLTEEEFLSQNITLAKILKHILTTA